VAGIKRFEIRDRGSVRVKAIGSDGTCPISSDDTPIHVTLVLGDHFSSEAGECGESVFGPLDCSFNDPGTRLRCVR
jgi:hypothetical protein